MADYYSTSFGDFGAALLAEIRREVWGRDIGQHSWLTAERQEEFAQAAGYTRDTRLLEVGCGSGGPALFLCESLGLTVTGIDNNESGISAANAEAARRGLSARASFRCADGAGRLPFDDASFDAVECIDAINHLADRAAVLAEWRRVLRPGGVVVYTDPVVVTGAVTAEEFALRSAIGFFVFVPPGKNEQLLGEAGFDLLETGDSTEDEAMISHRRLTAREKRRDALIGIEGVDTFAATQKFLSTVHALSDSRRLSRVMYLARKP
ncbi:MAG TPA: class I SAM-dependent methyltransferase [Rhizomicrobium sp.]|nr:class I SAM-dependent methyltransferase [Rhizomicrobium sp.]